MVSGAVTKAFGSLHPVDWLIVGVYALAVLGLGGYYARRQRSTSEYYTGGGRMSSSLIGISLFVTLLSTISYLAQPGEIIKHGPVTIAGMLGIPVSYAIVGYGLIPVLMRQRVTSAYELLEARLGMGVRLLGAGLFLVLRLVWMALMIHITSKAMTVVMGTGPESAPMIAAVSGMVAVVYASAGGMRAVVVTDFFQFLCLFAGALATVILVTFRMGGFSWWPTAWVPTWDVQPLFSLDPRVRATMVGAVVTQVLWNVCTAGGDQTAIQRYMSTTDARAARRAYLVNAVALAVVTCLLALVGFALLGYFRAHPGLLPPGMDLAAQGDAIFPLFIARHLPVGLTGLVVAALFAAAMSSIDSGVNSITAVVQTDFLDRAGWRPTSDKGHARFAQCLAFGIGVAIVAASSLMHHVPGNFLEMTNKTTNLLVTPIFGLFFLALFVPRATPLAAVAGCAYGTAAAVLVAYWDLLTGTAPLSFQWIGPVALAANLAVAGALCRWGPRREARAATGRVAAVLLLVLLAGVAGLLAVAHA